MAAAAAIQSGGGAGDGGILDGSDRKTPGGPPGPAEPLRTGQPTQQVSTPALNDSRMRNSGEILSSSENDHERPSHTPSFGVYGTVRHSRIVCLWAGRELQRRQLSQSHRLSGQR